jgi:hypothetical protein
MQTLMSVTGEIIARRFGSSSERALIIEQYMRRISSPSPNWLWFSAVPGASFCSSLAR